MIVTDRNIYLDGFLKKKLDLLCERTMGKRRFDSFILIDGYEGYGKSTLSFTCAYYCAWYTGREFSLKNVFFDADKMIDFAARTQDQIIVWDEAAIVGLASEWQNKTQKKLIKFVMIARKKRHIVFLNIPKFTKLTEYLAVDRSMALLHVYARNEMDLGFFAYFKKQKKANLYEFWRKKRMVNYLKFKTFSGRFTNQLKKIVDEVEYDKMKDEAIMKAMATPEEEKEAVSKIKVGLGKLMNYLVKEKGLSKQEIMDLQDISERTYYRYVKLAKDNGEIAEIPKKTKVLSVATDN